MTTDQTGHPAHEILAEIAEEAGRNPEPEREFEVYRDGEYWDLPVDYPHLLSVVAYHWEHVRRRPRTVRVSGEIDRELWDTAKKMANDGAASGCFPAASVFARALASFTSREGEG